MNLNFEVPNVLYSYLNKNNFLLSKHNTDNNLTW